MKPTPPESPDDLVSQKVVFDPKAFSYTVPPGKTSIYFLNPLNSWKPEPGYKLQSKPDGTFEYEGFFPPGKHEYRFLVVHADAAGVVKADQLPADGSNLKKEVAAPAPKPTPAPGAPTEDAEFTGAVESIRGQVSRVFNEPETPISRRLQDVSQILRNRAVGAGDRVKNFVKTGLKGEFDAQHVKHIRASEHLDAGQKEALATPLGRKRFRLKTFNALCEKSACGLQPKYVLRETLDETTMQSRMRRRLGQYFFVFERICSHYDAGSQRAGLDVAAARAFTSATESSPGILDRFRGRAETRAGMISRYAQTEAEHKVHANEKEFIESSKLSRFIAGGGDIILKYTAAGMLFSNPILAAGLWSAKGISQAMGFEFGAVLQKAAKLPFRLLRKGAGAISRALPDDFKEKLPVGLIDALEEPVGPDTAAVKNVSLSWPQRANAFLRGVIPFPSLLGKVPYVEKVIPDEQVNMPEQNNQEIAAAEAAVSEAALAALGAVPKPAVTPAPAGPTAPAVPASPAPKPAAAPHAA